ncbi:MAG: ABC transporter substrate-binding protein [Burkholderiales bacterium]
MKSLTRLVLCCLFFGQLATAAAADRLKIGHDSWIGYAAAMVAKEKGLFAKQGLQVETVSFSGPGDTLPPLIAGHLDVAFTTLQNLALMAGKTDQSLVAIYLLDTSNGADAVVAAKDISSPAGLKGRKVAVTFNEVNHMLLLAALDKAGLKPADVQMVDMPADEGGAAFLAGNVDAAVTWEPWVTKAKSSGGNTIFTSADTPNLILDAVVVKRETLAKNSKALAKLIKGIDAGFAYMSGKPDESRQILANWLKVSPEDVDSMLAGDKIYNVAGNRPWWGPAPNRALPTNQ